MSSNDTDSRLESRSILAEPADLKADCYSADERRAMVLSQRLRARLFWPLLRLLDACRVTPDHVTLLALIVGLVFCPLYFRWQLAAFLALALHVLLDGLDGPLARYKEVDSRSGSFTDTVSDQMVVVATTITLMFAGTVSIPAGGVYIFLYTAVVAFAMVRNALAVPYSWLFRPRFLVYAWLLVETWFWSGSMEYVIWACNLLLAGKMITGFVRIRRRI
jgi:phosphatidylglycerophosphate synthase